MNKKGIKLVQNQYNKLNLDGSYASDQAQDIDKEMWQINQASQGTWYQATTIPDWRLGVNLLYSVVIDGLGRQAGQ